MREAQVERRTKETHVQVSVALDGKGTAVIQTNVPFLDHMLNSLATHSFIDLNIKANGDLQHHVVEDVAIALGNALNNALGDRKGIRRFGYSIVPMDDALALAAVDLVRRPFSSVELQIERTMIEDAPREDLEHFLPSLITALEATAHVKILEGRNDHHKMEAAMKAFSTALGNALTLDPRRSQQVPSSKGAI